ncbi:hypothetical protein BDM02DRAFT_3187905 [Thelephora ganbajun]|uniref:Uncharacterized protein n=1 Tax=Thelephora ganbajun TaxID=370292 RepID=A0ACB6ZDF4_THEGA|nr:hypothetical protein BDM02DRAFT_3187905 [Thelephora ganbajun]
MLNYGKFYAWVECDGKLLPEYDVSVSGNKVTCWVPSQPGRNFTINWCDAGSGIDSQSFIELDGIVLPGKYIYGHGQARRTGVRTGDQTEKPFVFNRIDRNIDDIPLVGKESSIGSIVLKIKLVRRIAGRVANSPLLVPQQVRGKRRTGDDCIGYGAERQVASQHKATWKTLPWDLSNPHSFVTFVFRYRSVEWLTSEGIIPTPDAPVIPTPAQTPAIPPTPELSNASTPANTTSTVPTPSDRGRKRARREVSVSNANENSEPDTPIVGTSAQMPYPGQSFMWFNDSPFAFTHEKAQELQEHAQEQPAEPPTTSKRQRRK